MADKLPNYLLTYRKRSGLSQREVAFLLGCQYGTKVSRYERHVRLPNLETALAFEVIYQTTSKKLFEGIYREIEHQTHERAKLLADRLSKNPSTPAARYKLASLEKICTSEMGVHPLGDNQPLP